MTEFNAGDRVTFKSYTEMFVPPWTWEQVGHRTGTVVGPDDSRDLLVEIDGNQYGIDRLFLVPVG